MTIPSKKRFEEVLYAFDSCNAAELERDAARTPLTKDAVLGLLKKRDKLLDAKQEHADKCAALVWFRSQQGGKRAAEIFSNSISNRKARQKTKMSGKERSEAHNEQLEVYVDELLSSIRKDTTIEDVQREIEEDASFEDDRIIRHGSIEKYLEYRNSEYMKTKDVRTELIFLMRQQFYTWHQGVFTALRDYYYTDRWRVLYLEAQNKKKQLHAALDGLAALEALSSHLIEPVKFMEFEKSLRLRIEKQIAAGLASTYPIRRNDETARERTLMYDLYLNNTRHRIGKKPTIIYSLMMLDGIENQVDQRTIEISLSKWESARRDYRKKVAQFSETTTA